MSTSAVLLAGMDEIWDRFRARIDDLAQEEYLWEPVPDCWTIRPTGDGRWLADWAEPDPDPAPVTTIAWRLGHVAVGCLESYSARAFCTRALDLDELEWFGSIAEARDGLDRAWATFRRGVEDLGDDGLWRPLGDAFGSFADSTHLALVLHADHEVAHHGAEVGLLRDLYRAGSADR